MKEEFSRTALLLGEDAAKKLSKASVILFGVGGVGGYVAEALARAGIGEITLVDGDVVARSNINRQIIALQSTIGRAKTEVAAERIAAIDPSIVVHAKQTFVLPENIGEFDFSRYDYVIDAVDTVSAKLAIVCAAKAAGVPAISAMSAGNKLDPTLFRVADISKTAVCPLARVMRRELKARGVTHLKTVYSEEEPAVKSKEGKTSIGSVSFVPSVMGLIIAGEAIKDLIGY